MTVAERRAARIVLIGQAPGSSEDRGPLVGGPTGNRLRDLTGLTLLQYCRTFERRNLIPYYPGRAGGGKGDFFPRIEARVIANQMALELIGRKVIFVGIAVAEAFDAIAVRPFEWRMYRTAQMNIGQYFHGAAIPHTSPINHYWNSPANVATAREFFLRILSLEVQPSLT